MTEVLDADLGDTYWATTAQVRERLQMEVQNAEPDWETEIEEATDAIQARWEEATGLTDADYPATPPDLLQYATAYLAASEGHLHYASNVSGENQGDRKHVFLEGKADEKFQNWMTQADLQPGSSDDADVGIVHGQKGSLTDDII